MRLSGKDLLFTWEDVVEALHRVRPEEVQRDAGNVEMLGTFYPIEQVITTFTHWSRDSFTEVEGLNALTELGFTCRLGGRVWELDEVGVEDGSGRRPRPPGSATRDSADLFDRSGYDDPPHHGADALRKRVRALEGAFQTADATLLDLAHRMEAMEASASGEGH